MYVRVCGVDVPRFLCECVRACVGVQLNFVGRPPHAHTRTTRT